jgi:hypothetical protein
MGEAKRKLVKRKESQSSCSAVQTVAGRVQVRWEAESAATPMGQLAYFIEFLTLSGLWSRWIEPKNRSYPIPSALFWRNPTVGGGAIPVNVRLRCSQIRSQTAPELNCSVVVATQA